MEQLIVTEKTKPRLDAYILKNYPNLNGSLLNKYLRENKIKVNGQKIALSEKVKFKDVINLYLPYQTKPEFPFLAAKPIFDIVHECDNLIIANKPAGVITEDESGKIADTFINRALLYMFNKGVYKPENSLFTPCLCHRLDTGTSGLVLIAKTDEAFQELLLLIKNHKIEKEYVCVTFGRPTPPAARLKGYLTKDSEEGFVKVYPTNKPNSKEIITEYKTISTSGPLALLSVKLITGRTHQIRAHLASIDCPILGDSKYGNNSANRQYKLKYQALCAYSLKFSSLDGILSNISGEVFCAEKPWYFEQIIDNTLK